MLAAIEGFSLGAGLIVAIGAQNAFVLRQGITRSHVLPVVLFCAVSDALLILVGTAGFGSLVAADPLVLRIVTLAGAAFLAWYALNAWRNALQDRSLRPEREDGRSLGRILAILAAVTYLNPHALLDTVVLVGGIAGRYEPDLRTFFAAGAMSASAVWFTTLGFGARLLAPLFAKPEAWRVLDVLIGFVMAALALGLTLEALG